MIKRILQEVKEYRKASFLAPIFMVGEVVLEISLPFLMSFIIDKGVSQGDMTEVTKYGVIMIVAAFGSLFCGAMSGKYAAYASAGFAKNLRRAMFYNIQDFSFHNIDKFSTAGLVTRLMTDVTNIQNASIDTGLCYGNDICDQCRAVHGISVCDRLFGNRSDFYYEICPSDFSAGIQQV